VVTAAMVTSTKVVTKKGVGPSGKLPGPNGNGSKRRDGFFEPGPRANRYRIGIWVAMASILMMFTALSSAYIVRAASSNDWVPLAMPRVLLLSTALILISSITMHAARRKLRAGFESAYARLLLVTALLGFSFLASQLFAWKQLARQGIFLTTNPHSSFFYLLTATHGLHLMGGLLALMFLLMRARRPTEKTRSAANRQAAADAVTIYWHFMDALWIYLFLLLFLWR
jgi:cytochrome c oxidase subunit III